ncbi:MAG: DUF2284 domain-containing protein [Bacillota bacterium]
MQTVNQIIQDALDGGADRAVPIAPSQVVVDERVRLKCRVPICDAYNQSLMCPPNTLTVDEFKKLLSMYSEAILIQVRAKGSSEEEIIAAEVHVQNLISDLETKALMAGNYFVAGFGAAQCRLCPVCVGVKSGERCRHPFRARPSMEAVGINIYKTCENAGVPIRPLDRENLYFAGLLLLN